MNIQKEKAEFIRRKKIRKNNKSWVKNIIGKVGKLIINKPIPKNGFFYDDPFNIHGNDEFINNCSSSTYNDPTYITKHVPGISYDYKNHRFNIEINDIRSEPQPCTHNIQNNLTMTTMTDIEKSMRSLTSFLFDDIFINTIQTYFFYLISLESLRTPKLKPETDDSQSSIKKVVTNDSNSKDISPSKIEKEKRRVNSSYVKHVSKTPVENNKKILVSKLNSNENSYTKLNGNRFIFGNYNYEVVNSSSHKKSKSFSSFYNNRKIIKDSTQPMFCTISISSVESKSHDLCETKSESEKVDYCDDISEKISQKIYYIENYSDQQLPIFEDPLVKESIPNRSYKSCFYGQNDFKYDTIQIKNNSTNHRRVVAKPNGFLFSNSNVNNEERSSLILDFEIQTSNDKKCKIVNKCQFSISDVNTINSLDNNIISGHNDTQYSTDSDSNKESEINSSDIKNDLYLSNSNCNNDSGIKSIHKAIIQKVAYPVAENQSKIWGLGIETTLSTEITKLTDTDMTIPNTICKPIIKDFDEIFSTTSSNKESRFLSPSLTYNNDICLTFSPKFDDEFNKFHNNDSLPSFLKPTISSKLKSKSNKMTGLKK